MSAATYKVVKHYIEQGLPVDEVLFNEANAYAKKAKRGALKTTNFVGNGDAGVSALTSLLPGGDKPARIARADKPPAKVKEPKAPRFCDEDGCDKAHYSKDKCVAHYAAARRQDPTEKAKANEASKAYYARKARRQDRRAEGLKGPGHG